MTTYYKFAAVVAALLAISVVASPTGRRAMAWTWIDTVEVVERITHPGSSYLDRLDPTCPQCI
jgi:hypothetical protein